MKTLNTLILLLAGVLSFSQLQPFTDPEFGRFDPRFLHQGYLIGNNYTLNSSTGNYDVYNGIHKVNLTNGEAIKFTSETYISPLLPGHDGRQVYEDAIYLGQPLRKMSLSENHIYEVGIFYNQYGDPGHTLSGTIFGNRVYWFSSVTDQTYTYNLDNDQITSLTGDWSGSDNPPAGPLVYGEFFVLDNMVLSNGKVPPYGENWYWEPRVLVSINNSHVVSGSDISGMTFIQGGFRPNGRLSIDGRELFPVNTGEGGNHILSVDPLNLNASVIISNAFADAINYLDYIILPDGIIFSYDGVYYKTSGSSFLEEIDYMVEDFVPFHAASSYNRFEDNSSQGNSFVQIGDTTYFKTYGSDQVDRIYKMNSIHATPELVFSANNQGTTIQQCFGGIEWNGNLLFVLKDNSTSTPDLIYLYDGTNLILNPNLNTFSGKTVDEQPSITGLIPFGDILLVNTAEGIYEIEYEEVMSVKEETNVSKLAIYPNPVKDILHFSSPLKGIMVYDLSGKIVFANNESSQSINVNHLPKGTYVLTGMDEKNQISTTKFIKN